MKILESTKISRCKHLPYSVEPCTNYFTWVQESLMTIVTIVNHIREGEWVPPPSPPRLFFDHQNVASKDLDCSLHK